MKKEVSSGAEKAENLTRKKSASTTKKQTAKKPEAKKVESKKPVTKVEKEEKPVKKAVKKPVKKVKKQKKLSEKRLAKKKMREEKKLQAAKIKAEKKQKRLEKKLEHKQKRLEKITAFKEKVAERREKRRERKAMLKHETKEARLKRIAEEKQAKIEARVAKREAAAAERQARREHRLKVRAEKRADREQKSKTPGFGGWLAAVISLGVVTLALGSMVTYGWLSMDGMQADMAGVHTQSVYELNSVVDNLDSNLSKARVAGSANDRIRILSDIAIQSEIAETILERLPVDTQLTQNMTSFVNKMGDSAQSMLYSVARGNELTSSQRASLEYMYDVNMEMKRIINELATCCGEKDIIAAMRDKGDSLMVKSFGDIQNNTVETPAEINDGPFSDNIKKVSAKNLDALEEINATRAEELANGYFKDYNPTDVRCTGETIAEQLECYNIVISTEDGEMLAQLSKKGGKVVMFDSFKDCSDKNFSVDRCIDIATDFLTALGFDNMKAVWTSENGTTCNLNFVYEANGVIYYPDMIKVKVCEERGIVTGMEGLAYVLNHTQRAADKAEISEAQARKNLSPLFDEEGARLTVIPLDGEEALAYEFNGTYGDNTYYIYVDANTGDEIKVLTVVGTAQGRALM